MDSGDSKASDPERGFSRRSSVRVSVNVGEGDDLDFATATISDGFRPQSSPSPQPPQPEPSTPAEPDIPTTPDTPDTPSTTTAVTATTPRSESTNPTESGSPQLPARPSSIAKPPRLGDSYHLRHDGTMNPIEETASTRSSSSTTTSSQPYVGPESPYRGPSNPSHPYQMYPQNVRASRTMSVTTSSTSPASESSYTGSRGPAHPYSMYPQETVDESRAAPATAIPVGFPGVADRYQRRIGPEGEDIGDIIGPDGHTEQLPPYTRYPDDPFTAKTDTAAESAATPATTDASSAPPGPAATVMGASIAEATPVGPSATATSSSLTTPQPIFGAGGLGLATRDPEFEPADDLDSPHSRHSLRSFTSEGSNRMITQPAAGVSEKKHPTRGGRWGQRRLGGIVPYWAICLTIVVLILMSAVLGSVVGTLLAKHKKPPPHHGDGPGYLDPSPTATTKYDATPIARPTDLPDLVTGTFGMPLQTNRISSTCFNDTQLAQAWACNLPMFPILTMTIERNLKTRDEDDYTISLSSNASWSIAENVYNYGVQVPVFLGPIPLTLVNDTLEPARGPAWFNIVPYNKTVVLPESMLEVPSQGGSSRRARGFNSFGSPSIPDDIKRKTTALKGDRPWVCTWPDTLLEFFIYPMQNSSWKSFPGQSTTESPSAANPTATGSPTATGGDLLRREGPFGADGTGQLPSATTGQPPTQTTGFPPMDSGIFGDLPPLPQPYPRVVKMEERRLSDSPIASCKQYEIFDEEQPARPVTDAEGDEVVIYIAENSPSRHGEEVKMVLESRDYYHKHPLFRRDSSSDMSDCGCMWFIT